MKILKYLFLLLLLSLVTLTIFIATQKGYFIVERSKIVNSQKSSLYNYANDLKNWKDWNALAAEDASISINYSDNSIGKGSFISWTGQEGNGELKTIKTVENDSIYQAIDFNGNAADVSLSFKDTLGKTKVTYKAKGKMSFILKFKTLFKAGSNKFFGLIFEKSLSNLDKKLDYEMNSYTVTANGVVKKLQTYYLAQKFTSEFAKIDKNSDIVFSKITDFCKQNNISINGNPFVIYHTYDTVNKLTNLSICIPTKESFATTVGGEIVSDSLVAFEAVKTRLKGDYIHKNKALEKSKSYFKTNNLRPDTKFSHVEIYTIGKNKINNPSKWVTEIYVPIKPKVVYKPKVIDSLAANIQTGIQVEEKETPSEF